MDYLKSQKIIHWLMAVAIILDLIIAQNLEAKWSSGIGWSLEQITPP